MRLSLAYPFTPSPTSAHNSLHLISNYAINLYFGMVWGGSIFFNKSPENDAQLEEFPSLFSMQGHQGACGAFFSALWFALASIFVPNLWTSGGPKLVIISGAIILVYFALSWVSFSLVNYLVRQIAELTRSAESADWRSTLDRRVRVWMTILTGSYAFVCSVLIWLTGGAISPFTPFYVMIFTLTITKVRISRPGIGTSVLIFFLFTILVACIIAELLPTPIDDAIIRQSGFQIVMHIGFIAAALVVPTVSQYLVELREAKPLQTASSPAKS